MSLKGDEFAQIVRIPVDRGVKSTKKHKPNQKNPKIKPFVIISVLLANCKCFRKIAI